MLDLKKLVDNTTEIKENLEKRGFDCKPIDQIIDLDQKRKSLLQVVEKNRADLKLKSKEIGGIKKEGGDASAIMAEVASLKEKNTSLDEELAVVQNEQFGLLMEIPNLVSADTPEGASEENNLEIQRKGTCLLYTSPSPRD